MENRLSLRLYILSFILSIAFLPLLAQQSNFSINYTGPDTLYVNASCEVPLDWGHPNTVNITRTDGTAISTISIDMISGGFAIGDLVMANQEILINYFAQDVNGINAVLTNTPVKVYIADTIAPVLNIASLPSDITVNYLSEVPALPSLSSIIATDNCGVDRIEFDGQTTVSNCTGGTFTRSWSVFDAFGNRTTHAQTITLNPDNTRPDWLINPVDTAISCNTTIPLDTLINNWLTNAGGGIAIDSSGVTISNDFVGLQNGCGQTGSVTVEFMATDSCGNSRARSAMIMVTDDTPPIIVQPSLDTIVDCLNPAISFIAWTGDHAGARAADVCDNIDNGSSSSNWSIARIDTTNNCGNEATYDVVFHVADACGNIDSTNASYTIIDTIAPVITGFISDTTESCSSANKSIRLEQWLSFVEGQSFPDVCGGMVFFKEVTVEDALGNTTIWLGQGTPFSFPIADFVCDAEITAAFTFEDACGNTTTDTALFSLIDTIAPIFINLPLDTIVECDALPDTAMVQVMDNCDTSLVISFTEILDNQNASILRIWQAMDDCGNIALDSQRLMIIDTTPPILMGVPIDTVVTCGNIPVPPMVSVGDIIALDNCDGTTTVAFSETSTQSSNPDTCTAYNYILTRTWVATDIGGNIDSLTQVITVVDTIAPTFPIPGNATVLCELRDSLALTGMPINLQDNCDPNPTLNFVDSLVAGSCQNGVVDTLFRQWQATDVCGNVAIGIQQILLIDTIAPSFTIVPLDTMIQCSGDTLGMPVVGVDLIAIDNCLDTAMIQFVGDSSTQNMNVDTCTHYNYTLIRTWEALDACNNRTTFSQQIQVSDTIAPTFQIPNDTIVACEFRDSLNRVGMPINVLDNCDANPIVTHIDSIKSGDCQAGGIADTLLRIWRVSDVCGNFTEATQQLLLIDTLAPVFTIVPVDTMVACSEDNLIDVVIDVDIIAEDNCPTPPIISLVKDSTTRSTILDSCAFYTFTIFRTWEAVDACDNRSSYTQTIQVVDTLAPTFIVPKDTLISCDLRDSLSATGSPTMVLDDCDANPSISFTDLVVGGDCLQGEAVDTIFRTWRAVDACGNSREAMQKVILIDTLPPVIVGQLPDIRIQCTGDTIPMPVIGTDIEALDECSVPLLQLVGEVTTQANSQDDCGFYNYTLTRTWRATDACNNQSEFEQRIEVVDTIAPIIVCPDDIALFGDSLDCSASFVLPVPFYFDECNGVRGRDSLSLTQVFTNDNSGDVNTTPVDSMVFNFNVGAGVPTRTITGNVAIEILLQGVDGEGVDEYFLVIGEDGTILGQTDLAPTQCDTSATSLVLLDFTLFNNYALDSVITLSLIPNGQGAAAVNNLCSGGQAVINLAYDYNESVGNVQLSYQVDNGTPIVYVPNTTLSLTGGNHIITYIAEDCSGNQGKCEIEVVIDNVGAPEFECPAPQTFFLDTFDCEIPYDLPYPENFTDNCGFVNNINVTAARFLEFTSNANAGVIPVDFSENLLVGNINPIGDAVLTVTLQGDVSDPGEFFNIFGENGFSLGSTILSDSIGACVSGVRTQFAIPIDTLIAWSADGVLTISASANQDVINFSDFIGPCNLLDSNNVDQGSEIIFELAYPSVVVDYSVMGADSSLLASGFLTSASIIATEIFPIGVNTVTYTIQDAVNSTTCDFVVEVIDTIAPIIICNPSFSVSTNPSGIILTDVMTSTDSIFTMMEDNCGIADVSITPAVVSCDSVGLVDATITVTDLSGNEATCQTEIQVVTELLEPIFSLGACDNDTLYLFADTTFNTPVNPNTVFSYQWEGPSNFVSNEANPFIPGITALNTGSYSLTITGATGCTSSGTVFVNINELDIPNIETENTRLCENEDIILVTNNTSCSNVEYRWFEVVNAPDSAVQIATTTSPRLAISNPTVGQHLYYLFVACDDCISSPSPTISVMAFEIPTATTAAPIIEVCEGDAIELGATNVDPTAMYSWVGPGFMSNFPNPSPILNASQANQGVYTLIVTKNDCTSESDFSVVNIRDRADKPTISNQTGALICEGEPFRLISDITTGSAFNWTNTTTFATFTTTSPTLQIDTISTVLAGDWVLSITSFGCESETSDPVSVMVESSSSGVPFFTGSACEGGTITLDVNPAVAGATYDWEDSQGNPFLGRTPTVPAETFYSVTITSINGCQSIRTLDVEIQEPPIITAIFDSGDSDPCIIPNETEVILSADVFPSNDGTYEYIWSLPDGTTLTPNADSILIIPNTNATTVNGTYNLIVQTNNGCQSDPVTEVVAVTNLPTPNPSLTANSTTLCEGERLELTATSYDNFVASYHWRLPTIDTVTSSPILVVDPITTAIDGSALVQVFNGDCSSLATATINISVTNGLPQPVIVPVNNFCEGDRIELETDFVPGGIYFWEGPDFSATSSTPRITISGSAEAEHTGGYTVQIQSDGCDSPRSFPMDVNVTSIPITPTVNNSGDICLATETEVTLFVSQQTTTQGALYTWFDAATDQPIDNPMTSNTYVLDVSSFEPGTYEFYAIQEVDGCASNQSNTTTITLQQLPTNEAVVCKENIVICRPEDAIVCADLPSQGMGTWTVNNPQVVILEPNLPESVVQGIRPGETYVFTWTLSDPICGNYSFANLIMRVSATGSLEQACDALVEECDVNSVELCANALPSQFMGKWSQPSIQSDLGVVIEDINNPNTLITSIEPGRPFNAYTFYWTISDVEGTCPIKDTVKVNIYDIPTDEAMVIDTDINSCNGEAVVTAVELPTGVAGNWSSPDAALDFGSVNNRSTLVSDLSPGENTVFWNISAGACTGFSSAPVTIFFEQSPVAMEDTYAIDFSGSAVLDVTENDSLFSDDILLSIVASGTGEPTVNDDGTISYKAPVSFVGTDEFTYELCSGFCPEECTTATVLLNIGDDAGCITPTIITPNKDGVNDNFVVPCLESGDFPQNEVVIFNQWGDELFRASPYLNNWDGTYEGNDVPVGTYYYIVQFGLNEDPVSGFLILER